MSVLLATQELADLNRAGHGLADQILGITAVKIAHRQDVHASAQTVAQMAGTERVWESSYQLAAGAVRTAPHEPGDPPVRSSSSMIHPNTVKTLKTGQAVVITKHPEASARTVRVGATTGADRGGPELAR